MSHDPYDLPVEPLPDLRWHDRPHAAWISGSCAQLILLLIEDASLNNTWSPSLELVYKNLHQQVYPDIPPLPLPRPVSPPRGRGRRSDSNTTS